MKQKKIDFHECTSTTHHPANSWVIPGVLNDVGGKRGFVNKGWADCNFYRY